MKTGMLDIADGPVAGFRVERVDFFGEGRAWISAGRRRLGGRLTVGAAVGLSGESNLFDLGDRNRPRGQKAEHDNNSMRDSAIAMQPTSHAPRADTKQLSDATLCEAERAKRRAEFGR